MEKIIIVYSIMHTGTWFSCSMIEKTDARILSRSDSWIRESYDKTIEEMPVDRGCTQGYWKRTVSKLKQEDWSLDDLDVLILQAHHSKESNLIREIEKRKPEVPIVIPMRDPMLSLHSKIWRGIEYHKNTRASTKEFRKKRCKNWISLYKRLIRANKNVFLLPIDTGYSKYRDQRMQVIMSLARHCNVNFTQEMAKAADNWNKVNDTKNLIIETKDKDPAPRWENFKREYLNNNLKHTKAVMGVEFNMLQKDTELKEMLYNIGYRDLLWWK